MDVGVSGTGGATACPVCTLYLREGISLQRHLDTHPKEQVIEALIKASAVPCPPPPPPPTAIPAPQNNPPQHTTPPVSSQAPYPIGPVYECPPVSPMMPPQFASFSYQQFVNNGTMMIPQYAMAPQANQMMQMLYNPYGMYQQQQMPTVQMISPVSAVSATPRMRPMVAVSGETNRSNAGALSSEAKQVLPVVMPEPEAERVLPEIELPLSPPPAEQRSLVQHESNGNNRIEMGHQRIEQNAVPRQQSGRHEYQSIPQNLTITCGGPVMDENKSESVLPDMEEEETPSEINRQIQQTPVQHEQTQTQSFPQEYEQALGKEYNTEDTSPVIDIEGEDEKAEGDPGTDRNGENVGEFPCPKVSQTQRIKDTGQRQPEVEQLERLLITIMETEFDADSLKIKGAEEEKRQEREHDEDGDKLELDRDASVIQETLVNADDALDYNRKASSPDLQMEDSCDNRQNDNEQLEQEDSTVDYEELQDTNYDYIYEYKHSASVPASPITPKKALKYRTYSYRSEFGSNENLSSYPVGFEATTLHDDEEEDDDDDEEDDEKNEDNFDEEDMEIEEITGPHTPSLGKDRIRSHTPLSAISGVSVLRVRTDLSKPGSPASVHSFHHMDADSLSHEEDTVETIDPETEKDPIDCSQIDREPELIQIEDNARGSSELKLQSKHTYHQSVITENMCSFSLSHHSQQPVMMHGSYSTLNGKSPENLLDLSEPSEPTTSTESKTFSPAKPSLQKPSTELLNINEDAHAGPMNVFEFDGLQILVPSTFISESSQKAVSATSRQSLASSEGGAGGDEEVKSVNMRADETMPPRGELSEQESNGCNEPSAWQLYMGQESSRMSTSYDLMARESWEESEGSDNEIGGPLLDSRSLATHFTSSLFLDRDRKTPTRRMFKCPHCTEIFDCPKERRVHTSTVHKEAGPSGSRDHIEPAEVKDIKLLEGRMNVFDEIFVPSLHVQQAHHHQQPLLHQLQPPQQVDLAKLDNDRKVDNLVIPPAVEVSCMICGQRFSSEKSLQIHHRRTHMPHEGGKRVRENAKCQTCNEEFPSVVLYNSHLKIHPLECGQCGKYFYRKQNFKLHMKRHLGIKPFPCTVCDKAFLTKQKLDEHTNGHTGNAPVKCNLCNETFRRYSNLTQHKNRHHLNIKKKLKDYICHCGEVFHTKKKLAWHKETHDEKPKACTYCNERFIHMASLTRHMRRAHNRRFVPDAQRENENVECPICKCIYLRSSLAVHMRVHNGERPYECQVCSKAFSTKWNLQLHKWTHAARSTKPFKCNQCSAAFYRHSDYTAHMNSHRNVRPYTCNYCGAQFIRKYNCLRHVKEHEENKAYTCDICNKTFHRSYYLKEHLRVHSGARPYTCHICGKSSSTKSNHNKHVRIHHAREPVNTEN